MLTEDDSDQEDLDSATLQMLSKDNSLNDAEMEGLNMYKARMVPPHFCQATVKQVELSRTLGTMIGI